MLSDVWEAVKIPQEVNPTIRTITMGISLWACIDSDPQLARKKIYDKITRYASRLVDEVERVGQEYGLPIAQKRISVTPIAFVAQSSREENYVKYAHTLDRAATAVGVDFIGGFSALVHKGFTHGDEILLHSIPEALATTEKVCASVNVASTRTGINMDAVYLMGKIIKETATLTAEQEGLGCTKLVVFSNVPEDNPFMAGALHGVGEPECTINVGVAGAGVIRRAVSQAGEADFGELVEILKKTAFQITRLAEVVGRVVAERLGVPFGIVDLSLASSPSPGDGVAEILEAMGLERCGTHGTTAALALLNDAIKKGGLMASTYAGGLSGTFISVSEDAGMARAASEGAVSLDKLEAMTSVCSVGLDMIAVPGDTSAETLAAIIADEVAIGVINNKTTAVRIIPVPGKQVGDYVNFGGLLGGCPILPVHPFSSDKFVRRKGRIPPPVQGLTN